MIKRLDPGSPRYSLGVRDERCMCRLRLGERRYARLVQGHTAEPWDAEAFGRSAHRPWKSARAAMTRSRTGGAGFGGSKARPVIRSCAST
jgi:hypothetical protein